MDKKEVNISIWVACGILTIAIAITLFNQSPLLSPKITSMEDYFLLSQCTPIFSDQEIISMVDYAIENIRSEQLLEMRNRYTNQQILAIAEGTPEGLSLAAEFSQDENEQAINLINYLDTELQRGGLWFIPFGPREDNIKCRENVVPPTYTAPGCLDEQDDGRHQCSRQRENPDSPWGPYKTFYQTCECSSTSSGKIECRWSSPRYCSTAECTPSQNPPCASRA